nr:DNA directed RNA polymerase beta subunit b [Rhipidosiphon lewmanomontiae]
MLFKLSSIWKTSLKKFEYQTNLTQTRFLFFKELIIFSNFVSINNILFYLWFRKRSTKKKSKTYSKKNIQLQEFEKSNQNTYLFQRPFLKPFQWVQTGDLISDCSASCKGELSLGKNLLVGYMPWEGLNFEDAVLINDKVVSKYISLHIEKHDLEINETDLEKITRNLPGRKNLYNLDKNGIIKIGSWVIEGDILVGRMISNAEKTLVTTEKFLYHITGRKKLEFEEKSFKAPEGVSGRIIRIVYTLDKNDKIQKITFYIAKKRKFQVGDKISGRHGNKGIISKIVSNFDMPYMVNGNTLDVVLNPLGVPSRMNVGQILECLLGFAGQIFNTQFKVLCFDEIYGYEASRSFVYSKLFEACQKTNQKWLFNKKKPGKIHLFDGRNGELFSQSVLIGNTYLMKLIHIVDEKIHARSTGPYSLITQQPLRGRAKHGGQRFGEMEVWALQGFGCAYTLQELLTVKSDDINGRTRILKTIIKNEPMKFVTPESFRVILRELQCLCLNLYLAK